MPTSARSAARWVLLLGLLAGCRVLDELAELRLNGRWNSSSIYVSDSCSWGAARATALIPRQVTIAQEGSRVTMSGSGDFVLTGTAAGSAGTGTVRVEGTFTQRGFDGCIETVHVLLEGQVSDTRIHALVYVDVSYDRRTCGPRPPCKIRLEVDMHYQG